MLVPNWKEVALKSLAQWCAYIGLVLPDLVDFAMEWLQSDASAGLDPSTKNWMRALALVGVILTRPMRQKSLSGSRPPPSPLLKE